MVVRAGLARATEDAAGLVSMDARFIAGTVVGGERLQR